MPDKEDKAEKDMDLKAEKRAADTKRMHVKIHSPFKVYFDGEATSISAVNETGPFDILPQHHNFMTLLTPCNVNIRTDKGEENINIARGVMHVKKNEVTVFLDV